MQASMKATKDQVFSLMYSLSDGSNQNLRATRRAWGLFTITIELLQVVRVITQPGYGWTDETQSTSHWFDLVAVVRDQVRQWVPFVCFYILAALLVIVAVFDSVFIIKMTRDGVLNGVWPLKILRFLVATILTTLFTTTLEWLLYPLDCRLDEVNMAYWLHGGSSACVPWEMPDAFLSVFTILVVLVLTVLAMVVSLFAFELNPITRGSRVVNTGRVELVWTSFKVALGLLPFLSPLLSPLAVSIVLSLFAARAMYDHIIRLPFQSRSCNFWRGGAHAVSLWLCLASVANSSLGVNYSSKQGFQWALLALVPAAFVAGALGVFFREQAIHRFINILRAEYDVAALEKERDNNLRERSSDDISSSDVLSPRGRKAGSKKPTDPEPSIAANPDFTAVEASRRSVYEEFFDTAWKQRRAFRTGTDALLSCRHLLGLREEQDLPFLNFVVGKAINEHPDNLELLLFQLVVLRFIHCDAKQAQEQEKKLLDKKGLMIDRAFHLYAVIRRARSVEVSSVAGQAVNQMEFDSKMTVARKSHQNCLSLIKKFFHLVLKKEKSGTVAYGRPSPTQIDNMVACVHKYESAVVDANAEYSWLMEKFPKSATVILSYAHFTDTVLNDIKAAQRLRLKAAIMEDEGMIDHDEDRGDKLILDGGSSVSSENDSRSNIYRFMQSWRTDIVGQEYKYLSSLQMRVQVTMLLILVVSTVGFITLDLVLFSEQANVNLNLIDSADLFRALTVNSAFWLRSEVIASYAGDVETKKQLSETNEEAMKKMRVDHAANFKELHGGPVEEFYFTTRAVSTPSVSGWKDEQIDFWSFGNDFARRGRLAAATPLDQMKDPNWLLRDVSAEKRSVMYIQETAFREAIPFFNDVVNKYDENVVAFGDTAIMVVSINVVINALLVLLLSYMTITAIKVLTTVQFQVVACRLALSLPRVSAMKLYKYYHAEHHALTVIGDEQAQQDDIMAAVVPNSEEEIVEDATPSLHIEEPAPRGAAKLPRHQEKPAPSEDAAGSDDVHNAPAKPMGGLKSALKHSSEPKTTTRNALNPSQPLNADALLSLAKQLEDNAPGNTKMQHYLKQEYESHSRKDAIRMGSPKHRSPNVLSPSVRSPKESVARSTSEDVNGDAATDKDTTTDKETLAEVEEEEPTPEEEESSSGSEDDSDPDASPDAAPESGVARGEHVTVSGKGFGGGDAFPEGFSRAPAHVEESEEEEEEPERHVLPSKGNRVVSIGMTEDQVEGSSPRPSQEGEDVTVPLSVSTPDELREMDPEVEVDILRSVTALHKVHNRASTYAVVLLIIMTMCICSIVVPSRFIGQMVNLGPLSNNAAYRRTLVKSCAHLARELVLNDGFARMTQGEIAGTLRGVLGQLRKTDEAVRRGNLLRVGEGADYWSDEHNAVMYDAGCPWKTDGNCTTPDYPSAGTGGVFALSLQFIESVETVLETYGGPKADWEDTFGVPNSEEDLIAVTYQTVNYDQARVDLVGADKTVRFVMQGFSGDLLKGYDLVLDVLKQEMENILTKVHFELQLMYGSYVALLLVGFYWALFRRTISGSYSHTERARDFVQMLPSHTLTRGEVQLVREHFCGATEDA